MNPYSEDELIEQLAIALLAEMGWETRNCYSEFDQRDGSPLGRQTKSEVVLTSRLQPALERLNPTAEMYTKRPDLICFVNGIPLVLMEFKRIDVNLHDAYTHNIRDYKDTIPHLFWYNAFILLSNGTDSKVGSLTASWEHFAEWKRVHSEDESLKVSLETILQALCTPKRLLDVVENFIYNSQRTSLNYTKRFCPTLMRMSLPEFANLSMSSHRKSGI